RSAPGGRPLGRPVPAQSSEGPTMRSRLTLVLGSIACFIVVIVASPGQGIARKAILRNVGKGQLPSDTGQDDKTHPEIVDKFAELGGGKALKVPFALGDSFGGLAGANKNWKQYALLRFDAFNPTSAPVALELTVSHARSTS